MRIAIVYHSVHHRNTEGIARAMAEAIGADLLTISAARALESPVWDLVGLGSGIFFGKHHVQLLEFAKHHPNMPQNCFVFATAGIRFLYRFWHRQLIQLLKSRDCRVIGQFCSPGYDTVGPLKYIGGIHRGRPNSVDLEHAAKFARKMLLQIRADKSI